MLKDLSSETFFESINNPLVHYSDDYLNFLRLALPRSQNHTLTVYEKNKISGRFNFVTSFSEKYGTVVNSLPFFGSHGGPIANSNSKFLELINHFKTEIIKISPAAISVIENPFQPLDENVMGELGLKVVDNRIGQFTPLPSEMQNFHVKTRNSIRKGQKLNLKIEVRGDDESWHWMQQKHQESIISLKGIPKKMEIFNAIRQIFKESAQLWVGFLNEKPISAVLTIRYRNTIEYFTPVVDENYRDTQALSAVIYEAMQVSGRAGAKLWNWGGTWASQKGVYRFKSRWGSIDKPYRYFNKVKSEDLLKASKDEIVNSFPFFYVKKF